MSPQGNAILTSLVWQTPLLVAYLAVMVVAAMNWSRYPRPSLLTLAACGLTFALSIGQPVIQSVIVSQRENMGIQPGQVVTAMGAIGLVFNILRVVARGMLVTAVYTARTPAPQAWVEE